MPSAGELHHATIGEFCHRLHYSLTPESGAYESTYFVHVCTIRGACSVGFFKLDSKSAIYPIIIPWQSLTSKVLDIYIVLIKTIIYSFSFLAILHKRTRNLNLEPGRHFNEFLLKGFGHFVYTVNRKLITIFKIIQNFCFVNVRLKDLQITHNAILPADTWVLIFALSKDTDTAVL